MAKKNKVLYKLVSSAGTGYCYYGEKNTKAEKIAQKKYDPKIRKHVQFNEKKLSS